MPKENGYKYIHDELRRRISEKIYLPGSKLPPERLLCNEWQVERTTIRRALALLADEGIIVKKAGIGSVVAGEEGTPLISFMVKNAGTQNPGQVTHYFISPVYDAFAELCRESGYRSISMNISGANISESFDTILKQSCGVVLADNFPPEMIRRTRELGVPCVLMSEREAGFRSVLCDNDSGLMQAVQHLAGFGHKNIAYIGGEHFFLNARTRVAGFCRAMEICGLDETQPYIDYAGWGIQNGFDAAERLLTQNPDITAICTANDFVAIGAYRALKKCGYSVPDDFSLIGFGDAVDEKTAQIPLTTVRISQMRFARELFRSLMWEIEQPYRNPAAVLVEAELVIRGTAGKCR